MESCSDASRLLGLGEINTRSSLGTVLMKCCTGVDRYLTIVVRSDNTSGCIGIFARRYLTGAKLVSGETGLEALRELLLLQDGHYLIESHNRPIPELQQGLNIDLLDCHGLEEQSNPSIRFHSALTEVFVSDNSEWDELFSREELHPAGTFAPDREVANDSEPNQLTISRNNRMRAYQPKLNVTQTTHKLSNTISFGAQLAVGVAAAFVVLLGWQSILIQQSAAVVNTARNMTPVKISPKAAISTKRDDIPHRRIASSGEDGVIFPRIYGRPH